MALYRLNRHILIASMRTMLGLLCDGCILMFLITHFLISALNTCLPPTPHPHSFTDIILKVRPFSVSMRTIYKVTKVPVLISDTMFSFRFLILNQRQVWNE